MKYRRDPLGNFYEIQKQIDQFLDMFFQEDAFPTTEGALSREPSVWRPHMDVYETVDTFIVRLEIPGIEPDKDVQIELSEHILTIRGTRRDRSQRKKQHYHIAEVNYGPFERVIALPNIIDPNAQPRAHYENGFLEVVLPKEAPPVARRIPVTVKKPEREITVDEASDSNVPPGDDAPEQEIPAPPDEEAEE